MPVRQVIRVQKPVVPYMFSIIPASHALSLWIIRNKHQTLCLCDSCQPNTVRLLSTVCLRKLYTKHVSLPNITSAAPVLDLTWGCRKSMRNNQAHFILHLLKQRWISLSKVYSLPMVSVKWGRVFFSRDMTLWDQPSFQMTVTLLLSWIFTQNYNSLLQTQRENESGSPKNYL